MKKCSIIFALIASSAIADVVCDTRCAVTNMVGAWVDGNRGLEYPRGFIPVSSNSVSCCETVNRSTKRRVIWIGQSESSEGIGWLAGFSRPMGNDLLVGEYKFINMEPKVQPIACITNALLNFCDVSNLLVEVKTGALPRRDWLLPYEVCVATQYFRVVKSADNFSTNSFISWNPKSIQPDKAAQAAYMKGIALREQSLGLKAMELAAKLDEAEKDFTLALSGGTFKAAALYELACIACARGKYNDALKLTGRIQKIDKNFIKARVLEAYAYRKLGKGTKASKALRFAGYINPLDCASVIEEAFLLDDGKDAVLSAQKRCGMKEKMLRKVVHDYLWIGAHEEANMLMKEARERGMTLSL